MTQIFEKMQTFSSFQLKLLLLDKMFYDLHEFFSCKFDVKVINDVF